MGVRITPADRQPVANSELFSLQVTSAETNVASVSSYLGLPVKVLTAVVDGSPIAARIMSDLRGRGMEVEAKHMVQDGPWGYRHQFNIADSGFGARGPRVTNDRAGEVGRTLAPGDFDLERIFAGEGVGVLHMSGLIAALSPTASALCVELARAAKKNGTLVSFDLNYRASFWKGREQELSESFSEIASLSDILIGNEEDFQLCLGIKGPEVGGRDISSKLASFRSMLGDIRRAYPNAEVIATTLREVQSACSHLWGTVMLYGDEVYTVAPRQIDVLDRIGGGDGFVGGLLYSVIRGYAPEHALEFAWASGALAVTLLTDYATPADEEQIMSIWSADARVKR